jgi:hypothetical protein
MKVRYLTLSKWSNIYQRKQTKIKYKKKAQGHKLDKQERRWHKSQNVFRKKPHECLSTGKHV